jgi:hypothetical protein
LTYGTGWYEHAVLFARLLSQCTLFQGQLEARLPLNDRQRQDSHDASLAATVLGGRFHSDSSNGSSGNGGGGGLYPQAKPFAARAGGYDEPIMSGNLSNFSGMSPGMSSNWAAMAPLDGVGLIAAHSGIARTASAPAAVQATVAATAAVAVAAAAAATKLQAKAEAGDPGA